MSQGTSIETTDLYRRAAELSDIVWLAIDRWKPFAKDTVGIQLVKALDSVGANLVEGDGRTLGKDALRFFIYSRASAREARHWIKRAAARGMLDEKQSGEWIHELTQIVKMVHALIRYREGREPMMTRESRPNTYGLMSDDDLFAAPLEMT